jgi:Domain of unknown function (DUF4365)
MPHPKRRVFQHIMEDRSLSIVKQLLPDEWVIREYKPDYGIDLVIELFKYIDDAKEKADTLGEFIFVQLKSIQETQIKKLTVYPRCNVEKSPYSPQKNESIEIDVIPFKIDTNELLTVQSMGAGSPVILFLVALDLNKVFFVCLNDLLDKVIAPESSDYITQKTKVIYVPTKNELGNKDLGFMPIEFYAKRSKLYSAFCKFTYQRNQFTYLADSWEDSRSIEILRKTPDFNCILHFIEIILRYDFWDCNMWIPINDCYQEIKTLKILLFRFVQDESLILNELIPDVESDASSMEFETEEYFIYLLQCKIKSAWSRLQNLSNMYEEICREWYLPTFFAQFISYSD